MRQHAAHGPPMTKLLTREDFRRLVFARAGGRCVACRAEAVDAHHILERRLWADGGYYLANGAAVCAPHHLEAEKTTLSCEQLRQLAGIPEVLLPPHLHADERYDKWGNPILPNGQRMRGELFHDEAAQKMLAAGGVLALFTSWVKGPRTFHLPWSPGVASDDKVLTLEEVREAFMDKEVIVTEKVDGETTTMYGDHAHARSVSSDMGHPARTWVMNFWGRFRHELPTDWRLTGENLYARHSIHYHHLPSLFLAFGLWDERNEMLPWDDMRAYLEMLSTPEAPLRPVPILFRGTYTLELEEHLRTTMHKPRRRYGDESEGYVLRLATRITYRDYRHHVAKFVRAGHVQTDEHWLRGPVVRNEVHQGDVR